MADTEKNVAGQASQSYEAEMSDLRGRLNGEPYCAAVKKMLPELTKATIHGAVNGRNSNPLVLAALKIVVHKVEKAREQAQKQLSELAGQLEELAVAG